MKTDSRYCPECGLFAPCKTCGKPRLGVVPDSVEEAAGAITHAMAEIEKAQRGLDHVTAEKEELQKALSVIAEQLEISMKLEGEAEARTEKAIDRIAELEAQFSVQARATAEEMSLREGMQKNWDMMVAAVAEHYQAQLKAEGERDLAILLARKNREERDEAMAGLTVRGAK